MPRQISAEHLLLLRPQKVATIILNQGNGSLASFEEEEIGRS